MLFFRPCGSRGIRDPSTQTYEERWYKVDENGIVHCTEWHGNWRKSHDVRTLSQMLERPEQFIIVDTFGTRKPSELYIDKGL